MQWEVKLLIAVKQIQATMNWILSQLSDKANPRLAQVKYQNCTGEFLPYLNLQDYFKTTLIPID